MTKNAIDNAIIMASATVDDATANAIINAVTETVTVNQRIVGSINGSVGDGMPLPFFDNGNPKSLMPRFDIFGGKNVTDTQWELMIENEIMMLTNNQIRLVITAEFPHRYMSKRSGPKSSEYPMGRFGFPLDYVRGMRREMNTATGSHKHRGRPDGKWFRTFEIVDGVPTAVTDGHGKKIVAEIPQTETKQLS